MIEVLVPYNEMRTVELASQLREAVRTSKDVLEERGLYGLLERYNGDSTQAANNIAKGQAETSAGTLGHYAIIGETGDVIGSASIYPDLPLQKLRIPVPTRATRVIPALGVNYAGAKPNVHAWTREGHEQELADAYAALRAKATANEESQHPWTIEPTRAPRSVHDAIIDAGFRYIGTRRFNDFERAKHIPPRSRLYSTSPGRLADLRQQ